MENSFNNDPKYWKWGMFYFNREDSRIFPPKRNPYMGWTVNFANPKSMWLFVGIILVSVLLGWIIGRS